MTRLQLSTLAALVLAVSGCATDGYSYSQLDGRRYYASNVDTYPVIVSKVDGSSTPMRENPVKVLPGKRRVEVEGPAGSTMRYGETRTIELDVAPCTRYYIVAVKQNRLAPEFEVRIEHTEPVPGCTPPKA